jgi:hypothetical protein
VGFKESEQVGKEITKIIKLEFEQASLALKRIEEIQSKLKYHQLIQIELFYVYEFEHAQND